MKYTILRVTGDYPRRQEQANAQGALLYLEQHFNAATASGVTYPLALCVGKPRTPAHRLATEYAARAHEVIHPRLPTSHARVQVLTQSSRGYGNISQCKMPAVLLEPGFVSNPPFAAWARSVEGVEALARVIVHVVRGACPQGGIIALSVGHLGKTSNPDDRGAPVSGGGTEADLALRVIDHAHRLLEVEG